MGRVTARESPKVLKKAKAQGRQVGRSSVVGKVDGEMVKRLLPGVSSRRKLVRVSGGDGGESLSHKLLLRIWTRRCSSFEWGDYETGSRDSNSPANTGRRWRRGRTTILHPLTPRSNLTTARLPPCHKGPPAVHVWGA